MPLYKEDKQWIQSQIKEQLKLRTQVQESSRKGWLKAVYWLKKWGIVGVCITAFLALISLCVTLGIFAVSESRQNAEFRGSTTARLNTVEALLRELRASQSPGPVLKEISKLSQKEFARSLPALRKIEQQPVTEVKPSPELLRDVAQRLLNTDKSEPDYWPAVLRFIAFASAGLSPDVPPPGKPNIVLGHVTSTGNIFGIVSHQTVLLDGVSLVDEHFDHSRIIFTENPSQLRNVTFTDCVFEMPVLDNPNPYLQRVGRTLLASDLHSAVITSL